MSGAATAKLGLCALALLSCLPSTAEAQLGAPSGEAEIARAARRFYTSGQDNGLAFMITGSVMLTGGGLLVGLDDPAELRPAGYPLMVIGLTQLVTGTLVYLSNRSRLTEFESRFGRDRAALLSEERERMEATRRSLVWARSVEGVLVIAGLAAGVIGLAEDIPELTGVGFGTAGGAAATFALDTWWNARTRVYLQSINQAEGHRGMGIGLQMRWLGHFGELEMMVFKVLVWVCGLILISAGANDALRGAVVRGDFGELGELARSPMLNFSIRFLGTVLAGFGALMILFASDLTRYRTPLILAFSVVILGGLSRVASILQYGMAEGHEFTVYAILAVELVLVPALLIWLLIAGRAIG